MVSCLMGDSTALASAIVRCCPNNVISYVCTKFFRFLVSLKKISQDATQRVYEFVPMQDFTKTWIDAELYEKYGLTEEEIAFIESMIKPMELGGDDDGN